MTQSTMDREEAERVVACGGCRFWERAPFVGVDGAILGECRIRAPGVQSDIRLMHKPKEFAAIWPITGRADWCGEYLQREHI